MERRRYRPRKRAEQQARTRQRIVEAAADLHQEIGPAATTISAVAERAGVQRLTVYRHFPDEAALFAACSAHVSERNPPPDPSAWRGIEDARERLGAALGPLYAYYQASGRGLALVLRDAERLPALRQALAPMREHLRTMAEALAAGWRVEPGAERAFRAALSHALEFRTWESLAAQGLRADEAARLAVGFVTAAAETKLAPFGDRAGEAELSSTDT